MIKNYHIVFLSILPNLYISIQNLPQRFLMEAEELRELQIFEITDLVKAQVELREGTEMACYKTMINFVLSVITRL